MIRFIKELLGAPKQGCPQCHCLEQRLTKVERDQREDVARLVDVQEELAALFMDVSMLQDENARLLKQVAVKEASQKKLEAEVAHILMHVAKEEN